MLRELGYFDIIFCLDGDFAGQNKTEVLLDKYFAGTRDIQLRVINLPDSKDPDDFFRDHTLEDFNNLERWTAFEWRLNRCPESDDSEDVCEKMIPLIVNEPNIIRRDAMCRQLGGFTGTSRFFYI